MNNGFPNYIVDKQIKRIFKNICPQNKHSKTFIHISNFFTATKWTIRGSLNKFPDFFRMGTFIDSTHMKL